MTIFILFLGELYRRRDPWYHGQEAQYPKHVGYCSRRPRQIYPDRFPFVQSWYHCWIKSWWNQSYRHQKRRAGEMYYHQIHVSFRKDPKKWKYIRESCETDAVGKCLWHLHEISKAGIFAGAKTGETRKDQQECIKYHQINVKSESTK